MPRFKLTIEYDGSDYVGWQRQANGPSIQQALEDAAAGYCGAALTVQGAGRTDAGVHAPGQVADVDVPRDDTADTVRDALNAHLKPQPISVVAAEAVSDDFHARFSATGRTYAYHIISRRAPLALDQGRAWWVARPLEAAAMNEAAQALVGHHDFTTFRAAECQAASPVKTLDRLSVWADGARIVVEAAARSFLHHQVRNMVGTLKLVGEGKWSPDDVAAALAAQDRSAGGPMAPADGLYLTGVVYGEETKTNTAAPNW